MTRERVENRLFIMWALAYGVDKQLADYYADAMHFLDNLEKNNDTACSS